MGDTLKDVFGGWAKKPADWFAAAIALVAAIGLGVQAASSLSSPLIRWVFLTTILALCLGGLLFSERSSRSLLDHRGERLGLERSPRSGWFSLGAIFSLTFLLIDVSLNFGGFLTPVEFRGPTISGGASARFPLKDGLEMEKLPVNALNFTMGEFGPFGDFGPWNAITYPQLNFIMRKRSHVKELVIRDITLTVLDYRRPPTHYDGQHPATPTDDVYVYFEVSKRSEKLPWKFKPSKVIVGGKVLPWSDNLISFRDDFSTRFHIAVHAKDPGVYTFTAEGEFVGDFNVTKRERLTNGPVTFLYISPDKGQEKDGSPIILAPKEGEEIVKIGPSGIYHEIHKVMLPPPGFLAPALSLPAAPLPPPAPPAPLDLPEAPPASATPVFPL